MRTTIALKILICIGLICAIATAFAATPTAKSAKFGPTPNMICVTCGDPGGNYTQTVVNANNSQGQILALEQGSPQSDPQNSNFYTNGTGELITITRTGNTVSTVYPVGQVNVTALSNGETQVQISATAGACEDGTWYVGSSEAGHVLEATVTLDAQGIPTNQQSAQQAENLQQMLWCRTTTIRNNMKASANLAGLNTTLDTQQLSPQFSVYNRPSGRGLGLSPQMISVDCGIGMVGTAIGFAAWIAMPLDPLAYWGMATAYIGTARACGWD